MQNIFIMIRIKELLKEKGITINQLADMLEVSRQALSKQIQGKMRLETAEKIAKAIDVPIWQLFISKDMIMEDQQNTITCPHCGGKIKIEKSL